MLTAATWLSFAFALGLIVRVVGLPPLVGYLLAGFILSALGHQSNTLLEHVAHAGVLLLLFGVGLKLRLKSLFRLEVLVGSMLHMALTSVLLVFLLQYWFDLSFKALLLIAIALSFSSTVIAAKILETKRELRAFHGRVAIGILIMQDLAAVAILSMAGADTPSPWAWLLIAFFVIRPIIYKLLDLSGHGELLILYGLLLALVIGASSFEQLGLSSELGALVLGVILADHKRAGELSKALWGLKEVLLVGFFLQIGLAGHPTWEIVNQALLLNLILPIKVALFFFILLLFRLRARSSFLAGLSLATYSEFGLIIAHMGVKNAWLDPSWLVLLGVTVAMSFAIAAPINHVAHDLYRVWERKLKRFESRRRHPDDKPILLGNSHIVILGMGRVGTGAYDLLSDKQHRVVGLDSDPVKVEQHRQQGRRVLYADAEDPGLWEKINLKGIHAILLAVPDLEAKLFSIRQLREIGFNGLLSTTAVYGEEIELLQKAGADNVYNYYENVGTGYAEVVMDELQTRDPAQDADGERNPAGKFR